MVCICANLVDTFEIELTFHIQIMLAGIWEKMLVKQDDNLNCRAKYNNGRFTTSELHG